MSDRRAVSPTRGGRLDRVATKLAQQGKEEEARRLTQMANLLKQYANAISPIFVTSLLRSISPNLEQNANALSPISTVVAEVQLTRSMERQFWNE